MVIERNELRSSDVTENSSVRVSSVCYRAALFCIFSLRSEFCSLLKVTLNCYVLLAITVSQGIGVPVGKSLAPR